MFVPPSKRVPVESLESVLVVLAQVLLRRSTKSRQECGPRTSTERLQRHELVPQMKEAESGPVAGGLLDRSVALGLDPVAFVEQPQLELVLAPFDLRLCQ